MASSSSQQQQKMMMIKKLLIVCLLLFPLVVAAAGEEGYKEEHNAPPKTTNKKRKNVIRNAVNVVVEGVVYCQSCERYGTWSLSGAHPIPAATISVICKDYRNRVSYYKAFKTDQNGYFYALLQGFKMSPSYSLLDHPLTSCKVKLVSSPLQTCNLLSNLNYGINGSPLRYESKKFIARNNYNAVVVYSAGPLAFRPAHCTPTTTLP
ncbi:non-classical arabinogalactan protein 30-like [Diospyros lotus]|uniref:non-classical arabinogalactan protein 30-like n=1 Tax=Diospyros lotus TaxID=55363 RepID=UPI0022565A2D|nr:non-classical arabinogalactan protein 30-like [Diospyros lotus]